MNLQNLPARDERGGRLKRCIIPKLDCFLLADYKAMELRMMAWYMAMMPSLQDFTIARMILDGFDPHKDTAMRIFHLDSIEEVTKAQRDKAKTTFFSLAYAGTYKTIYEQGIVDSEAEARIFVEAFHAARPELRRLDNATRRLLWKRAETDPGGGYVKTIWGRKLRPPQDRLALNWVTQGSCGDVMKDALIKVGAFCDDNLLQSHLVLTIHDELILDAAYDELPLLVENLPRLMANEQVAQVLPMDIDIEIAHASWAEVEEYVA